MLFVYVFRKRHVEFHVLVVQTRERNEQKCAARAEMLFCIIIKPLLFSPRRCRRQSMVAQAPLHVSYVRYYEVRIILQSMSIPMKYLLQYESF